MARPTDYSEDIIAKALAYVELAEDETNDNGKLKVNLPSIEGLASFIDVNRDTIYEWCKVHKEFSDIIEKLREKQTQSLINNGLAGTYNPTIAKVLLSKHGYSEKTETDITTGGKPLIPPEKEQAIEEAINNLIKP
jgi:hypothetical protein